MGPLPKVCFNLPDNPARSTRTAPSQETTAQLARPTETESEGAPPTQITRTTIPESTAYATSPAATTSTPAPTATSPTREPTRAPVGSVADEAGGAGSTHCWQSAGTGLVILRWNTAAPLEAKHGKDLLQTSQFRSKIPPQLWLCGTNEPGESLEYHNVNIERRLRHSSTGTSVHAELNAATAANKAYWRQQDWRALSQ